MNPALAAKHRTLLDLATDGRADPAILAQCAAHIATMLGCERHATAARPWDGLSAAERDCLDFAERFVLAPHTVDDDLAAAVRGHLGGDAALVAFTCALALFDGRCRMDRMSAAGPAS